MRRSRMPPFRRKRRHARTHEPVAAWLLVCCALVFAMVVVGGVTRLTHSGLSIVEWQPHRGHRARRSTPPEWEEAFARVPGHARVPAGEPGHDARGLQGHLLVGVLPPAARSRHRLRVPAAARVVRAAPADRSPARAAPRVHLRPGPPAGSRRVVDGEERAGGRPEGESAAPHHAPRHRLPDLRRDVLDRARSPGARRIRQQAGRPPAASAAPPR